MKRFLATYFTLCALLIAAWQCFAQVNLPLLGVGGKVVSGGCLQATTVNNALDGSQNTSAVTTAVCGMVTDGDYANLVGLYVLAASSAGNALINWATPGTNNAVLNGGAGCTRNNNASYTGDAATCYFATGITPSTIGNSVALNSLTLGVCVVNNRTTNQNYVEIGAESSGGGQLSYMQPLTSAAFFFDVNGATFPSFSNTGTAASWIIQRTGSANVAAYKNGSAVAGSPFTDSSITLVQEPVILFGYTNHNALQTDLSADSLAYGLIGNGSINAANIRARLNTYVGAIGSDSC